MAKERLGRTTAREPIQLAVTESGTLWSRGLSELRSNNSATLPPQDYLKEKIKK